MHLSVSQLNLFKRCPLAWKYSYIDKIPTEPTEALRMGTLFHQSIAIGNSEVELLDKMVKAVNNLPIMKYSELEFEMKVREDISGYDFIYILDAVDDYKILEFKSSKMEWEEDKFNKEWQAQLYIEGERIRTGKIKDFYYIIATKHKIPRIQLRKVKRSKKVLKEIFDTAKQLKNEWEFKGKTDNCYFCNYKKICEKYILN